MKREGHVCIDKEAKWTHLSCPLFAQPNLNIFKSIKNLNIQMWLKVVKTIDIKYIKNPVRYLSVPVCKDGGSMNIKYMITSVYCTCHSKQI